MLRYPLLVPLLYSTPPFNDYNLETGAGILRSRHHFTPTITRAESTAQLRTLGQEVLEKGLVEVPLLVVV